MCARVRVCSIFNSVCVNDAEDVAVPRVNSSRILYLRRAVRNRRTCLFEIINRGSKRNKETRLVLLIKDPSMNRRVSNDRTFEPLSLGLVLSHTLSRAFTHHPLLPRARGKFQANVAAWQMSRDHWASPLLRVNTRELFYGGVPRLN